MNQHLPKNLYDHFLLFHAACRILCSSDLALIYNEQAKHLLRWFFVLSGHLYGRQCQISNMHNLIHLADDVKTTGCSLSHLTTFPFENLLGKLKKKFVLAIDPWLKCVDVYTKRLIPSIRKQRCHRRSPC
uniref:Uncharacterized protein n=1 Tax=Glypta fumiferanae TaxID=389681 RepID=A0A0F6Q8D5_9HYME|nr:hypothetical protein [Glypta fumiferanae]